VNQPNPSVVNLFDVLARELQAQLSQEHSESVAVSWSGDAADPAASDLTCWSWILSVDSASRILVGAPAETWKDICRLSEDASPEALRDACLSRFTPAIEQTARSRFGSEVTCLEEDRSNTLPPEWTSAQLTIKRESGTEDHVQVSVNPDLELALGTSGNSEAAPEEHFASLSTGANRSADILMDVEMPVSVALGRTKMRLKSLLNLTNGSVVELDQELGEEVEIRVNKCVIAYGEVVAVDGNYAVRIKRMAPARSTPGIRGLAPERAA
jgi:flagellar motor switch protein FliN